MTGAVCVRGIGRSCGCERCESKSNWFVDWLGNIVEVEEEDLFYDDEDEGDDEQDEEE